MRNLDELPTGHPAGTANLLMHVAGLSTAAYIEQPLPQPWLSKFLWGLAIGCGVTAAVVWSVV